MEKTERKRIITPVGTAKYPRLEVPDTKFKPEGEYRVQLVLDPNNAEAKKFLDLVRSLADEACDSERAGLKPVKAKTLTTYYPFRDEYGPDGEPTGNVEVLCKTLASFTDAEGNSVSKKLPLFDASGAPITKTLNIGSGSKICVACEVVPFYAPASNQAGISLRMRAVQIIELKTWQGGTAEKFGFAKTEGFVQDEVSDDQQQSEASDF